ncbi:dynein intermediate chain 2, ciliary-like isoform X2 [Convolutriloba macropyga]|uniref:dynein intermediate chain 2, ciliary-like isoform X2 n=1 Tax=Convolutriloba macropyga TaxID=536237 RepID=UPI003F520807
MAPAKTKAKRKARVSLVPRLQPLGTEDESQSQGHEESGYAGMEDWMTPKQLIKPDDQLELTDAELKEEITRILTANNPHAPDNIIRFSFKENQFRQVAHVDQLAIHFALDGNLLHKDSEEAKHQLAREALAELGSDFMSGLGASKERDATEPGEERPEGEQGTFARSGMTTALSMRDDELATPMTPWPDKDDSGTQLTVKSKKDAKPANQFNYSERASQTYNNPLRERYVQTEPPPRHNFSANANQWEIYDAYMEDLAKNEKLKAASAGKTPHSKGGKDESKTKLSVIADKDTDDLKGSMSQPLKILERMVNQNTFDEISEDFKYYEDPSDEYKDNGNGTLLPLWTFSNERTKKLACTALKFNPLYSDLFTVGYGSYDFLKQGEGLMLCYSLKNPSYPEFMFETESGVMCVDVHPTYPYLMCVGLYSGHVAVYNMLQHQSFEPEVMRAPPIMSTAEEKHADPVWQINWQKDDIDTNLVFFSVSSDGYVLSWTLVKNELKQNVKMVLQDTNAVESAEQPSLESGTAMAFHSDLDYLYLVGTEDGKIRTCSKAFSSQYLDTIQAHYMGVYKAVWNPFHNKIFMTCSADWSVKIWDHSYHKKEPMFVFDLNSAVGDVAWAPYSSTVFAAVTADGNVYVFDLSVNKYEEICRQMVAKKKRTRLTHIEFNPKHPILIVGDDRGYVQSIKLSPNLRKMPKERKMMTTDPNKVQKDDKKAKEIEKMEKLLALVREPEKHKDTTA